MFNLIYPGKCKLIPPSHTTFHLPGQLKLHRFTILIIGKDMEDLELLLTVGGCINRIKDCKMKAKYMFHHDSSNPLLLHTQKTCLDKSSKSCAKECLYSFIHNISKLETNQKPIYKKMNEWQYILTIECYTPIKKNEILIRRIIWINFIDIILSKRSET